MAVVTVYQPDGPCVKCANTKRQLTRNKVPYTTVTADDDTINRFRAEGHVAFPIVVVDLGDGASWTWSDFRNEEIKRLASLITA